MDFEELFACDSNTTINFFYQHLREEVAAAGTTALTPEETRYTASVLAHYAQTSREATDCLSAPASLMDVFDCFVRPALEGADARLDLRADPDIMETAGAQTLLLAGFFRAQMSRRHNLRWYDELGRDFYSSAAARTYERRKMMLLQLMAEHFAVWTAVCRSLSRSLHHDQYLLSMQTRRPGT
jgi:hypothetical protein